MLKIITLSSIFGLIVVLLMGCPGSSNPSTTVTGEEDSAALVKGYTPFPPGYNYPLPDTTLNRYISQQDMPAIRNHGWNLWAGINQPAANGKLVWQTWFSVSQAFAYQKIATAPALSSLRKSHANFVNLEADNATNACTVFPGYPVTPPIQNCGPDNGFLANNGDVMIAGVLYNFEAYWHIRKNKLYLKSTLQGYIKNPGTSPGGSIPQFPKGSIVLKHMYWPVKQDGYSALPVWDQKPVCSPVGYNGFETWTRAVAIDPTNAVTQPTANVTYLYMHGADSLKFRPRNYPNAKVVPINQFYLWKIDKSAWDAMTAADQCIINNAFQWAYGRNFKPGDYLVSIAMHIITKEIYDWTMQSLWWHDQPDNSYYAQNKPGNIAKGAWQNYLLTTAYSMETPREKDGSANVAYNPYIELVIPEKNRIVSNCQNCHTRGAWPEASQNFVLDPIGAPNAPWSFGAHYNSTQRGLIKENDSIFKGIARTDFQWAIPDRAVDTGSKK
jgi:hypothetical protein